MSNIEEFNNDLVFERDDNNNIICGGYKINSTMPLVGVENKNSQYGGNIGGILNNLAVPAGLFFLQQTLTSNNNNISNTYENIESDVVDSSLYDNLLNMVSDKKKFNKKTRRNKIKLRLKKKTLKNK